MPTPFPDCGIWAPKAAGQSCTLASPPDPAHGTAGKAMDRAVLIHRLHGKHSRTALGLVGATTAQPVHKAPLGLCRETLDPEAMQTPPMVATQARQMTSPSVRGIKGTIRIAGIQTT
ncbi:hypothetical protein PAPYR_8195 [Paratrimastix pyriformis]|uniref:Uncharacterized protein n=1 Tax=Paratrimastix pyriformis TaxID=342808 RepID=A0ABQ8UB74_9EUKA|nr:hypothetical protein PAPYR_8195 [Paratrimastix pyriformis]